ncbi:MAG TPA: hypothetical protein VF765_09625 [Polyangiaceae bacterium]
MHPKRVSGVMVRRVAFFGAACVLAAACSGGGTVSAGSAGASGASGATAADREAWRKSMSHSDLPGGGCFRASFPSTTWERIACTTAPQAPHMPPPGGSTGVKGPGGTFVVGDGQGDFASQMGPGNIRWSEGSFPVTSAIQSVDDTLHGAGQFSLQLNTNTFNSPACAGENPFPGTCAGWVQFVYDSGADNLGQPTVFMQYWLINFGDFGKCPPPPKGQPFDFWEFFDNSGKIEQFDCHTPSTMGAAPAPLLSVTDLSQVVLTGLNTPTVNAAILYTPPGNLVAFSTIVDAVDLRDGWTESEFNIFGESNGSQALFNNGASATVQVLTYPTLGSSNYVPTACDNTSFTGETNDLFAKFCWPIQGGIQFTEGLSLPISERLRPVFHVGGWFDGGPGDPGPYPGVLPWSAVTDTTQVLRLIGTSVSNATSSFTPAALSLLGSVAAGTADAIIGDDVAEGVEGGTTPDAVVVVNHGTTTVQGALRVDRSMVDGLVAAAGAGSADPPPGLRAYDAYDAVLYALDATSAGATLTRVDVTAALAGRSHVTTTPLAGSVPQSPQALVWDRFTRTLFAVDRQHEVLRLLAIDPVAGRSEELWRTNAIGHEARSTAYLSVSLQGEIVLALADEKGERDAEIVLLDATGAPQLSARTSGRIVDAPQAVPAGVDVPVTPGIGDYVGTRVDLLPRADMEPGICGAPWLAAHATGALARDARRCPR